MAQFSVTLARNALAPGEAYLDATPVLKGHAGTQPDLFVRWNTIPLALDAIDVVVHLHGFSRRGAEMPLSEKVPRSGLDLSRRTRPTLALLPRGNWMRLSWYDFPALLDGGLGRLVEYGLERFAAALPSRARRGLGCDRLVLTAHSGGGMPAVDAIAGVPRPPDELHVFDGLYGHDPATGDPMRGLDTLDAWLAARVAGEPARPGALRVVYYRAADRAVLTPARAADFTAPCGRRSSLRGGAWPTLPGRALASAACPDRRTVRASAAGGERCRHRLARLTRRAHGRAKRLAVAAIGWYILSHRVARSFVTGAPIDLP